jgi:hypothetical protein
MNHNLLPNNNCKLINIVWIDRGIILTILTYILKYYELLHNKIIIINIKFYRLFFKILFPKLKFKKYKKHSSNNFYFNIRTIIKKQNIIIDYLSNYNKYVKTTKINLVPWYDLNDPLIVYEYNKNKKIKLKKFISFIDKFSLCKRANYFNQHIWDTVIENKIIQNYNKKLNNTNQKYLFDFINKYLNKYIFLTNNPQIYYIEKPIYKDKIIEKPIYKDKIIEKTIYKDKIIEKPIYKNINYNLCNIDSVEYDNKTNYMFLFLLEQFLEKLNYNIQNFLSERKLVYDKTINLFNDLNKKFKLPNNIINKLLNEQQFYQKLHKLYENTYSNNKLDNPYYNKSIIYSNINNLLTEELNISQKTNINKYNNKIESVQDIIELTSDKINDIKNNINNINDLSNYFNYNSIYKYKNINLIFDENKVNTILEYAKKETLELFKNKLPTYCKYEDIKFININTENDLNNLIILLNNKLLSINNII